MRYMQMEAAAHWGVPIDEFTRRPVIRQAEMIAHLLIKGVRDDWAAEQMEKQAKASGSEKPKGYNPIEAQRRAWKLG